MYYNKSHSLISLTHLIQVTARCLRSRQLIRIQLQLSYYVINQLNKVLILILQQQILGHLKYFTIEN